MEETFGLGRNALTDIDFLVQFVGTSGGGGGRWCGRDHRRHRHLAGGCPWRQFRLRVSPVQMSARLRQSGRLMLFEKIIVSPLCTASICLSVTLLAAGLAAQIAAALVPQHHPARAGHSTLAALSLLALVLEVISLGEPPVLGNLADRGHWAFGVLSLCAGSADGAGRAAGRDLGGAVFLICEVLLHSSWTDLLRCRGHPAWLWCPRCCCGLLHRSDEYWDLNCGRGSHTAGQRAAWIGSPVQSQLFCKPDYPFRYRLYAEHRKAEAA